MAERLRHLPLNTGVVGSSPRYGYDYDSSYDTSTGWFQEVYLTLIYLSCENCFHNQAKINVFKLMKGLHQQYRVRSGSILRMPDYSVLLTANSAD